MTKILKQEEKKHNSNGEKEYERFEGEQKYSTTAVMGLRELIVLVSSHSTVSDIKLPI